MIRPIMPVHEFVSYSADTPHHCGQSLPMGTGQMCGCYPEHPIHLSEDKFPEFGLTVEPGRRTRLTCISCHMSMLVNLDVLLTSQRGTELRPCLYCWTLHRVPDARNT